MVLSKLDTEIKSLNLTSSTKRRIRRRKLQAARAGKQLDTYTKSTTVIDKNHLVSLDNLDFNFLENNPEILQINHNQYLARHIEKEGNDTLGNHFVECQTNSKSNSLIHLEMSSKELNKAREEVLAAREAKKIAKQLAKLKANTQDVLTKEIVGKNAVIEQTNKSNCNYGDDISKTQSLIKDKSSYLLPNCTPQKPRNILQEACLTNNVDELKDKDTGNAMSCQSQEKLVTVDSTKCKDEVDRASFKVSCDTVEVKKSLDQIKAERAEKKAAKHAKKKGSKENVGMANEKDLTVKDVVETLQDIVNVAKDVQEVTAKVTAIELGAKKTEENVKSKAELRAERRAKQESQRAAKQAAMQEKVSAQKTNSVKPATNKPDTKPPTDPDLDKAMSPKPKSLKLKTKPQTGHRVNWFQHLYTEHEALKNVALNSNLHPAVVKLGVQLGTRVITGSNARCIALLDALKKMVRDYTLPAKTEFGRGLEVQLAASLKFLWSMRQPSASQSNAVKFFRHHLTQLPNNVDEFDAKKRLQEEIERYVREQIDMAGEAISMTVRKKISDGDTILTYGCSSLIVRILREAWAAGVKFQAVVVGNRVHAGAKEMLRRLVRHGVPCSYIDITALSCAMKSINKVLLGCSSLLVNGSVVGAVGTAQVALAARGFNVPVLVACETHKFSERVHTDAFVYNEIGDPDALIDQSDDNSPLKDWRSNQNLTPLNLIYDVTPPSLVTAVVTELAILPCTSAPVVLRFKLSEYGI